MITKAQASRQAHEKRMAEYRIAIENMEANSRYYQETEHLINDLFTRCYACEGTGMNHNFTDSWGNVQEYVCPECYGKGFYENANTI